jgi:hypothetical protein
MDTASVQTKHIPSITRVIIDSPTFESDTRVLPPTSQIPARLIYAWFKCKHRFHYTDTCACQRHLNRAVVCAATATICGCSQCSRRLFSGDSVGSGNSSRRNDGGAGGAGGGVGWNTAWWKDHRARWDAGPYHCQMLLCICQHLQWCAAIEKYTGKREECMPPQKKRMLPINVCFKPAGVGHE